MEVQPFREEVQLFRKEEQTEMEMEMTKEQEERYSRNMLLKNVGAGGQKKLMRSKVLVIGAGGLGAPALMYLAASGVGTLGIADGDDVDLSNLQRQIIHENASVGRRKVDSAAERIRKMNPEVKTVLYPNGITPENICGIIRGYDFVLDCVDDFASKFLINDACVLMKKPFCHGGILEFSGQVMTVVPDGKNPCYRCVFEEIPAGDAYVRCSQAGVIGTVPGVVGSIQAMEAQKYILGAGELLTGKMLVFDGLEMKFRTVGFGGKPPHCRVCGKQADIREIKAENYRGEN